MALESTSWVGQPHIKGTSETTKMIFLTFAAIGLQFCWGTEMTYCNPYLLSLGLSKSKLSLVWVAGPLSGLVMQPVIGVLSDKSTSKWGRRRPFMLGSTVAVCACMLLLGWSKEVVGWVVGDAELRRRYTILLAVMDIYVLDFLINIAQSTCRALVIDMLPISKQQVGSAWVSRMTGIGHLLVYAIGALDLNSILGNFLGDSQLKKVCAIAALAMAFAQGLTCWAVQERVLVADSHKTDKQQSIFSVLSQIYTSTRDIPPRIQAICMVQFWSWIGWFPFLFYRSTWVGEIYLRHEAPANLSNDALNDVGRHGSMSLIVFSTISFAASIVLPWFVRSPDDDERPGYTARPPRTLEPMLKDARISKPSLLTAWTVGNLLFAAAMIFAPFVQSVFFATILIAFCGIPWAVAGWAPGTFLGVEVNRMSSAMPTTHSRNSSYRRLSNESIELDGLRSPGVLHLRHDSTGSVATSSTGELSGIYLGILNIYTTLPQFVGTGITWIVFSIFEPGKSPELAKDAHPDEHHSTDGLSGIGVCLFIGAVSAVGAAWATRRLKTA